METLMEQLAPNLYLYRDKFYKSCLATMEMFWKAGLIAGLIRGINRPIPGFRIETGDCCLRGKMEVYQIFWM